MEALPQSTQIARATDNMILILNIRKRDSGTLEPWCGFWSLHFSSSVPAL